MRQRTQMTYGVTWLKPRKPTHGTSKIKSTPRREIEIRPGTPTWIDDGAWGEPMGRVFDTRRALRVTDILRARLFVVRDVVSPPRFVSFVASLVGGSVVSTTLFADATGPVAV